MSVSEHGSPASGTPQGMRRQPGSWQEWVPSFAAEFVFAPRESDDKYRRGVVGMVTGSVPYPGAALLGTGAAARTGVGMVRYQGPPVVTNMVLLRRPEVVPAPGRVQAWVLGSGVPEKSSQHENIRAALAEGVPAVVDAGALLDAVDPRGSKTRPLVFTPHAGEVVRLLAALGYRTSREDVEKHLGSSASILAQLLRATVLVKGNTTHITNPHGMALRVSNLPPVLATAGSGDVLAGIMGGLLTTAAVRVDMTDQDNLTMLAATAALVHGRAAALASNGGPIVADDIVAQVPQAIAELIRLR